MQDCKRESVNCGNCFRLHRLECDEYPMAAAVEATQHAMSVSGLQNGVHGTFMRRFFKLVMSGMVGNSDLELSIWV